MGFGGFQNGFFRPEGRSAKTERVGHEVLGGGNVADIYLAHPSAFLIGLVRLVRLVGHIVLRADELEQFAVLVVVLKGELLLLAVRCVHAATVRLRRERYVHALLAPQHHVYAYGASRFIKFFHIRFWV